MSVKKFPRDMEGDDDYYMSKMKEILDAEPMVGPPAHPGRMLDHVFIGNQDNAEDYDLLPALGITHVLNCAGTRTFDLTRSRYPEKLGIVGFLMMPAEDYDDFDIAAFFPEAISFLDKTKAVGGKALVHCNLGVNRSGAITAAYLMVHQRKTLLKVISDLKDKRSVVLCNVGFRRQLLKYARARGLLDDVEEKPRPKEGKTAEQKYVEARATVEKLSVAHRNAMKDVTPTKNGLTNGHADDTVPLRTSDRNGHKTSNGYVVPRSYKDLDDDSSSEDDDTDLKRSKASRAGYSQSKVSDTDTTEMDEADYRRFRNVSLSASAARVLEERHHIGRTDTPASDRYERLSRVSNIPPPNGYLEKYYPERYIKGTHYDIASAILLADEPLSHPLSAKSYTSSYMDDYQGTTVKPRSYYHRKVVGRVPRYTDEVLPEPLDSKATSTYLNGSVHYRGASYSNDYDNIPEDVLIVPTRSRCSSARPGLAGGGGGVAYSSTSYQPNYASLRMGGYSDDLDEDIAAYTGAMYALGEGGDRRSSRGSTMGSFRSSARYRR